MTLEPLRCIGQTVSLKTLSEVSPYRGTSLIRKRPPPEDFHRDPGIVLLQGPKGVRFLVSEVTLYPHYFGGGAHQERTSIGTSTLHSARCARTEAHTVRAQRC